MMEQKKILIVANQTAGGEHLKREVSRRLAEGPCVFTLLVPATPPTHHATWTDEEARALARSRMEQALTGLRELGAEIEGVVGDVSPMAATDDILRQGSFDEIILSTLPVGLSRWLKQDLPHRMQRRYSIRVTHVLADRETTTA
jgi:hypothetical protein